MVRLLLFGKLKDITGFSEIKLSGMRNTRELKKYLFKKYPQLRKEVFLISVNREIINQDIPIKEDDEIAFLPPVSGG